MQYLLLLHANEAVFSTMTPEQQQQGLAAYMAWNESAASHRREQGQEEGTAVRHATILHRGLIYNIRN